MHGPQRGVLWVHEIVHHLLEVTLDVGSLLYLLDQVHFNRVHNMLVLRVLRLLLLLD